jgi:hypothetical protein
MDNESSPKRFQVSFTSSTPSVAVSGAESLWLPDHLAEPWHACQGIPGLQSNAPTETKDFNGEDAMAFSERVRKDILDAVKTEAMERYWEARILAHESQKNTNEQKPFFKALRDIPKDIKGALKKSAKANTV